jgi:(p)ppGpp synthase/HD superfamily hydrolase
MGSMSVWSPDAWLAAWRFASDAHQGQRVPGSELPYVVHVGAVSMEIAGAIARRAQLGEPVARPDLAIRCALLHDVVEDTAIGVDELAARFGSAVAEGVAALTKNPAVGDKPAQMRDSLARIRKQPPEIWMVKLADRITNLQPPPRHWTRDKIRRYHAEAQDILAELGAACSVLETRLGEKIEAYAKFADEP